MVLNLIALLGPFSASFYPFLNDTPSHSHYLNGAKALDGWVVSLNRSDTLRGSKSLRIGHNMSWLDLTNEIGCHWIKDYRSWPSILFVQEYHSLLLYICYICKQEPQGKALDCNYGWVQGIGYGGG